MLINARTVIPGNHLYGQGGLTVSIKSGGDDYREGRKRFRTRLINDHDEDIIRNWKKMMRFNTYFAGHSKRQYGCPSKNEVSHNLNPR